jgi:hypothetical protein
MKDQKRNICPICEKKLSNKKDICDCGFSPNLDSIENLDSLNDLYKNYKNSNWRNEVKLIHNIHKFQSKKLIDWTQKKTARLLNIRSRSQISKEIDLAIWLEHDQMLKTCENKSQAIRHLEIFFDFYPWTFNFFDHEKDLQNYLIKNWKKTPFKDNWLIYKALFNTKDVGTIDILAKHKRKGNYWKVIEIKRQKISADKVVGQILRYMGWVKKHKTGNSGQVEGTIILGFPFDINIDYSIEIIPNLEQIAYYKENNVVKFLRKNDKYTDKLMKLKSFTLEDRINIFENYQLSKK